MHFQFDSWLLTLSLLIASVVTLIAFSFVEILYTAPTQKKKLLQTIFSVVLGTAIWANHILLSYAFKLDEGQARNIFPSMTLLAWGFAVVTAALVLNGATRSLLKHSTALGLGSIAALSLLGLYFFDSASIHGVQSIHTDLTKASIAVLFTCAVITGLVMLLSWLKSYAGKNIIEVKLVSALIVALNVAAIHAAFDRAFAHGDSASGTLPDNMKFMGIIIALATLSAVLISYVLILFFEKHGVQIFQFSLFNREKNTELETKNLRDSLTKLPNRLCFQQHLNSAAKRSDRLGSSFALAYIDLDGFKPINDQYGHTIGDNVLTKVAERLNATMRSCDFVARIGGDEFVAIIGEIKSNEDISPILERMLNSIKEPFMVNDILIEISCSIGIAIYPKDGDLDKLIVNADTAMYKAKENGRAQYRFYDEEIESATDQLLMLQRDLCLAIEKNEFSLQFQTKIDSKTQQPVGAEAFIRWQHPVRGEILPMEFIAAAERFGLINEIGNWVVSECCRVISQAKSANIDLNISINLSSHQFRNPNLVRDILMAIKYYDVNPSNLTFEIKETVAINNQGQFKHILSQLNEAGIHVALDDFGLHPISISYLQQLNVKELKLDKIFVSAINESSTSRDLITGVIRLAHAINLKVVAEGVETELQRDALVALDCDMMQGYLFSEPVSEESLITLFKHLHITELHKDFQATGQLSVANY